MPNENPSNQGAFSFNLRFPGQYFDKETNLAYNANRDYDASTGRYIESDPIGLGGGINTYTYVGGKPLTRTDIFGLADSGGFFDSWPWNSNAWPWNKSGPWSKEKCAALKNQIDDKYDKLSWELEKYDPVADAVGGFSMKWGSGTTKPGGHYQEIKDLQRGIKNDVQDYNKRCRCDDDDNNNPPISKSVDELANTWVQPPLSTGTGGVPFMPLGSSNLAPNVVPTFEPVPVFAW